MKRVWVCAVTLSSGFQGYETLIEYYDPAKEAIILEPHDLLKGIASVAETLLEKARDWGDEIAVQVKLPFDILLAFNGRGGYTINDIHTQRRDLNKEEIQELRAALSQKTKSFH